jgi:hypothetical protein
MGVFRTEHDEFGWKQRQSLMIMAGSLGGAQLSKSKSTERGYRLDSLRAGVGKKYFYCEREPS